MVYLFVDIRVENITTHPHLFKQPPSRLVEALKIERLKSKYVFAPDDKAANNVNKSEKDTTWMFLKGN